MWLMWGTVSSWICPRSPFPSPPPQWLNLGISLKITDLELKDQRFLLLRSGSGKEYAVVGGGRGWFALHPGAFPCSGVGRH